MKTRFSLVTRDGNHLELFYILILSIIRRRLQHWDVHDDGGSHEEESDSGGHHEAEYRLHQDKSETDEPHGVRGVCPERHQ